MIYLYLFGTCFHFIYVFMIIGKEKSRSIGLTYYPVVEAGHAPPPFP